MGTIFQGLEDSYVQDAAAFNVFMYMINNKVVRDYVKVNELTLGEFVDYVFENRKEIVIDFYHNEDDYVYQNSEERRTQNESF